MQILTLDAFADLSDWSPVASGQARLALLPDSAPSGQAMRLEFDFGPGGGFVVARRLLPLILPESYVFVLEVRASAPANAFEFKLVDPSGANVWRFRDESFAFATDWRTLRIPGSAIDFGWGPAGGGVAREVGAIEIVVAAGPGGAGRLWIADLRLEDRTPADMPLIHASGAQPGHATACILDGCPDTCWRADRLPAWVDLDFREERDYGGLILCWDSAQARRFQVMASNDGSSWRTLYAAPQAAGAQNPVYLPGGCSRFLRLALAEGEGDRVPGLVSIAVQPESFARSLNDFFHRLAADAPRGRYPRWLSREQSYWTPVDVPDGAVPALFNEEGMVEIRRAGFSIEPCLVVDGALVTWADCTISQGLTQPPLPIPESLWTWGDSASGIDLGLTVTACATGVPGRVWIYLRYRVENRGTRCHAIGLHAVLRPFQVSPPWQGWRDIGGVSPIQEIAERDGAVWVNGRLALVPLTAPSAFGAAAFDEGTIGDALAAGGLPVARAVSDPFGYASCALGFDLALEPGAVGEVYLAAPLDPMPGPRAGFDPRDALPAGVTGPDQFARALEQWSRVLGAVDFKLPALAQDYLDTCKGALAHILINRDGPALQPGPRRYTRSWIRDGAGMAAALLRLGRPREAEAFIRWYAPYQAPDGNVPCCVDKDGADWLPEHDSHGQLIFAVADYYRFTGDRRLVEDLWPAVRKAVGYLEHLRAQRLTADYRSGDRRACYGLLPESVSHEGYLAHPVHSYWDDFWALRGLKDAAELATVMGEGVEADRLARLRDDFRATLQDSLLRTLNDRGIDFLPGSVEWADPDPTATANALTLIDETHHLPAAVLHRSFDLFMERFRAMHGEHPVPWTNYTPYEIRIVGALVRLGRRDDAHELARFFLAERRPTVWNQWPEIAWHDPRAPGHQGDLPHAWIGAEYCLAFRDMFAYERESDQSLVVGAGIPSAWLEAGAVSVKGLPTWYGKLDLALWRTAEGTIAVRLGGDLRLPPGGIRLAPPVAGPLREVRVNGVPSGDVTADEVRIATLPAEVAVS